MSYIHCYDDNYYKPGVDLLNLFANSVVQPFENHPRTQAWENHVRNKDFTYHREKILGQGRTNFDEHDEHFEGLTPKDLVLIYCLHYMPMHLFSSYHIFTKHSLPVSDKVVFIDFGCGPLTSGIAFWAAFARNRDITYLGIDSAKAMLDKAREINRHGPYRDRETFIKGQSMSNYNRLHEHLDSCITGDDQTQIIFNFCYFLASKTLNVDDLSDCLTQIVAKYSQHKMCMIYQNPVNSPDLHHNWRTLKGKFSTFKSQGTQSDEKFSCDWLRLQNGRLIWRRTKRPIDVYFDILSNEVPTFLDIPFMEI